MLSEEEILNVLQDCLLELYKLDDYLVKRKGMERSIHFRLAHYLQCHLRGYDVIIDCEYNKREDYNKVTDRFENGIRPDIICHIRGSQLHNVFAIEIKHQPNEDANRNDRIALEKDREKLEDLTLSEPYNYRIGILVETYTEMVKLEIYEAGRLASKGDWNPKSPEFIRLISCK